MNGCSGAVAIDSAGECGRSSGRLEAFYLVAGGDKRRV